MILGITYDVDESLGRDGAASVDVDELKVKVQGHTTLAIGDVGLWVL